MAVEWLRKMDIENVLIVENNSRAFAKACIFIHRGKILRIIVFRMTESKDDQKKSRKKAGVLQ